MARRHYGAEKLPNRLEEAFLQTPRHVFVPRYLSARTGQWETPGPDGDYSERQLDELYADHPLCIHVDRFGQTAATISQPTLVLYMAALLQVEPGQRVFELGGGSGWNAALLARLAHPDGSVHSVEIVESLVQSARRAIESLGIENAFVAGGDGRCGLPDFAPFDRGVFTASSPDLPGCFFDQIGEGGILLFVARAQGDADWLLLLRKRGRRFEAEKRLECSFVPVVGQTDEKPAPIEPIERRAVYLRCKDQPCGRIEWGRLGVEARKVAALARFLEAIHYPNSELHSEENPSLNGGQVAKAIETRDGSSVAVATDASLQGYGDPALFERLRRQAERWAQAGCPALEALPLQIVPAEQADESDPGTLVGLRGDAAFVWQLDA